METLSYLTWLSVKEELENREQQILLRSAIIASLPIEE